jgi:predicted phage gp36 major capsid-like protein
MRQAIHIKTQAEEIRETIESKSKLRSEVALAIKKMDEVHQSLRAECAHSISWGNHQDLRNQFVTNWMNLNVEILKLESELQRETAPMIKPQPKGVSLNGWDV